MNQKIAQKLYKQGKKIEVLDNGNWLLLSDGIEPKDFKEAKTFRIKKNNN